MRNFLNMDLENGNRDILDIVYFNESLWIGKKNGLYQYVNGKLHVIKMYAGCFKLIVWNDILFVFFKKSAIRIDKDGHENLVIMMFGQHKLEWAMLCENMVCFGSDYRTYMMFHTLIINGSSIIIPGDKICNLAFSWNTLFYYLEDSELTHNDKIIGYDPSHIVDYNNNLFIWSPHVVNIIDRFNHSKYINDSIALCSTRVFKKLWVGYDNGSLKCWHNDLVVKHFRLLNFQKITSITYDPLNHMLVLVINNNHMTKFPYLLLLSNYKYWISDYKIILHTLSTILPTEIAYHIMKYVDFS